VRWVKLNVFSVLLTTVNSLCCVIVGLIVWYQYKPTTLSASDTNKYAIIGALQLWMLLVADVVILLSEVRSLQCIFQDFEFWGTG